MANKYNISEDARIWHVGDIDPEDFIDVLYELKEGEEWYSRLRENGVYLDDIPAEGAVTKLIKMIFGAPMVQNVWKSVEAHEKPEEFWMRYVKESAPNTEDK